MMIWHSSIESDNASGRGRSRRGCLIGERLAAPRPHTFRPREGSGAAGHERGVGFRPSRARGSGGHTPHGRDSKMAKLISYDEEARRGLEQGMNQLAEDRKSTRLNSSHVAISYAVFC